MILVLSNSKVKMQIEAFGKEICTIKPSYKKAILWTLAAILPVLLFLSSFLKFKNYYLLLAIAGFCLPAIYNFSLALFTKIQIFEKAIISKTLFGTKILLLDGNTKIYISQVMASGLNIPVSHKIDVTLVNQQQKIVISESKRTLETALQFLENFQQTTIFPYLVAQFKNNQDIDFGRIQLNKGSITFRKKTFQWQQVGNFVLQKNTLSLHEIGGSFVSNANNRLDLTQIANPKICLAFLLKLSEVKKI